MNETSNPEPIGPVGSTVSGSPIDMQTTLSLAMRGSRMGAWRRDLTTNEVWWSRELEEIFGLPPQGFVGTENGFYDFVHADDHAAISEAVGTAIATRTEYAVEFRFYRADGTMGWMEGRGKAVYAPGGEPLQLYGIGLDITDRKRSEERLRQANERFNLAEQALDGFVYELNIETNEVFRSAGFGRVLGYGPGEVPPTREAWVALIHPDDHARVEAAAQHLQRDGIARLEMQYRVRHRNGHWVDVIDYGNIVFDAHGKPVRLVGTTLDHSAQKRQAEALERMVAERTSALEQANLELARSNEELQRFAYVASHDLQEPLRKLQSFGEMIVRKNEATFTDSGRLYFDRMILAARRMESMLESLLEFSRAATTERKFENTDLSALLNDVLQELRDTIEEKKAVVEAAALPVRPVIPIQFRQLLTNLLGNALKYSKDDQALRVRIGATVVDATQVSGARPAPPGSQWLRLQVEDNGIGFDPAYADRIFELFARLHGRSEYSGSGIGLAICKRVAENHGGFIAAHGAPGEGARFEVYLPA